MPPHRRKHEAGVLPPDFLLLSMSSDLTMTMTTNGGTKKSSVLSVKKQRHNIIHLTPKHSDHADSILASSSRQPLSAVRLLADAPSTALAEACAVQSFSPVLQQDCLDQSLLLSFRLRRKHAQFTLLLCRRRRRRRVVTSIHRAHGVCHAGAFGHGGDFAGPQRSECDPLLPFSPDSGVRTR